MGYRYMTVDILKEIFRRWHSSHSITSIKSACGFDRNTIRNYISLFKAGGYSPGCEVCQEDLIKHFQAILPLKSRARSIRKIFEAYKDEIIELITRAKEPVKPKTAFIIVKAKYDLPGSYETFKLFMQENKLEITKTKAPLRIELPPGKETQIDYGKVGTLYDPLTGRNRIVWAFCSRLSFSRLPYVEFVFTQNQENFVESNVRMAEFYGGLTDFISIDNLKAGVIKPDLYDPRINRAYADFAEYYGTFINPCRVGKADDKGKIERLIPPARELFRRLKEIHPTYGIQELNGAARNWCLKEYGLTKHGTTGVEPVILFNEEEKAKLRPLPAQPFVVPVWKYPTVHSDRFFAFEGKYYAMPHEYRGKRLNVCRIKDILRVFHTDNTLLREYCITGKRFSFLPGDFPADKEAMMQGSYPRWLMARAHSFGPATAKLIRSVLESHAYIHARRARGILGVLEKYRSHPFLQEICGKALRKRIHSPKALICMLEEENKQSYFDFIIPRSNTGDAMIRDVDEYFN